MTDTFVHALGVSFAIVAGTGAGILALLSWEIFRESPFGTVIALASVSMSISTIYHVVLLVVGSESLPLRALRSSGYTAVALFVLITIRRHRRLRRARSPD